MRIVLAAIIAAFLTGCYPINKKHSEVVLNTPSELQDLKQTDRALQDQISSIGEAVAHMQQSMKQEINDKSAAVEQISENTGKITLQEKLLFDSGSQAVSSQGRAALAKFAETFRKMPTSTRIRIVGHTDSMPIGLELRDKYTDNWDLSALRAATVARYFVWGEDIKPKRLHIEGSADTDPVASNLTEEGRAKNRRIEIFVEEDK